MHTVYLPDDDLLDALIRVIGEEAKHATRVKRLEPGERVLVMNGRGVVVTAAVEEARRELVLRAIERHDEPTASPRLEVWSATPKGDRLGTMIEGLVQAGCAEWVALDTKLGVVDPGDGKIERVKRIALEASKQARRAWMMEVGRRATMREALRSGREVEKKAPMPSGVPLPGPLPEGKGVGVLMLDARGEPLGAVRESIALASRVRVLVGPEGGWTESEIDEARRTGARLVSIGPHAMRIETAAVVGCAMVAAGA